MGSKKWLILLAFINILAIAGIVYWYVERDTTAPVIMQEQTIVYKENMQEEELLPIMRAVDETDGDVSDSLVVEKIIPNPEEEFATITYGAMDASGNIAKYSVRVEMEVPEPEPEEEVSSGGIFTLEAGEATIDVQNIDVETVLEEVMAEETADGEGLVENPDGEATEDAQAVQGEEAQAQQAGAQEVEQQAQNIQPQNAETPRQQAQNTQPQVNPEEIPVLNFGAGEVKTKKGHNPAWVTVISQLQDNKDNYEYLLQHLVIHGNYTNAEVGAYDVTVSTVDSDGHESAPRALRIIVEE